MTNYYLHNSQARNAVSIEITNWSVHLLHVSIAKYLHEAVCRGNNSLNGTLRLSPERPLVLDVIRHCYHLVFIEGITLNALLLPYIFTMIDIYVRI